MEQKVLTAFWSEYTDPHSGKQKLHIDLKKLYAVFEAEGFMQIEINPLQRLLVQIKNNVVTKVDLATLEKTLNLYINKLPYKITENFSRNDLHNAISNRVKHYIDMSKINYFLPVKQIEFLVDSKEVAYFFFKNGVVEVSKEKIIFKNYADVPGYIWNTQIIDHEFVSEPSETVENFDFCQFTKNLCSNKLAETPFDADRWYSLICCVGYLLYNFKIPSKSISVIFTEANLTEDPQGRTGKGLLMNAISKLRKMATIDGKIFRFDDRFCYQNVDIDTQIVFFDDILKHFDFRKLFSVITEGMSFEKKNQQKIKLAPEKSPKIAISTNYTVRGDSESDKGRRFDMELYCYYNATHKPEHDFGRQFFYDYNNKDWNSFYNFMLYCVQCFLKEKKIPPYVSDTQLERRLINETCIDFIEFGNDCIKPGEFKPFELLDQFRNYSQSNTKSVSIQKFGGWVKTFCAARSLKLEKKSKRFYDKIEKIYLIS